MVDLDRRTPVVQHLGTHILLRVHVQFFRAGRVFEPQFVKPLTFIGLRFDRHLGFLTRQAIGHDVTGVIGTTGHYRLIGVATQKIHNDFLTDAGNGDGPPSLSGPGLGDPHPAGAGVIPFGLAVPRKLQTHASVVIGIDFFPGRADDFGYLRAVHDRFIARRRPPGLFSRHKIELTGERGALSP
ncbi:hypothetical protein D3C80_1504940 [compost metagenome]